MPQDSIHQTQQNRPAILLYRGHGLIDGLIKWQTRSEYSHAAILIPNGNIIESYPGVGVRLRESQIAAGFDFMLQCPVDAFDVPEACARTWANAIEYCRHELGAKYDWKGIARFITRLPGGDPNRWFCSELVAAAFRAAGRPLLARIEPWAISPELLSISPKLRIRP